MKKSVFLFISILITIAITLTLPNSVNAGPIPDGKMDLRIESDTKDLQSKNKLYFDISIVDVEGIDPEKPISFETNLAYDVSLLKNPSITAGEQWNASLVDGRIEMSSNGFDSGITIATLSFDVITPVETNTKTKISLMNVDVVSENNYTDFFEQKDSDDVWLNGSGGSSTEEEPDPSESENIVRNETGGNTQTQNTVNELGNYTIDYSNRNETIIRVGGNEPAKDTTTSNRPIPQTGVSIAVFLGVGIAAIIGVYTYIREKKFYD